jgi:hypothetical protein
LLLLLLLLALFAQPIDLLKKPVDVGIAAVLAARRRTRLTIDVLPARSRLSRVLLSPDHIADDPNHQEDDNNDERNAEWAH